LNPLLDFSRSFAAIANNELIGIKHLFLEAIGFVGYGLPFDRFVNTFTKTIGPIMVQHHLVM